MMSQVPPDPPETVEPEASGPVVGMQTVYLGDARAMPMIPDGSIDLVITSPPYWHLKDYGSPGQVGQSSYADYLGQLNLVWDECYRCARRDAVLVINVNSRRHEKTFYPIAFDIVAAMRRWRLWDHVIWYIPNALPQPNHYRERLLDNKFESCLVFTKDGSSAFTFHKPRVPQKYAEADPRAHKKDARGRCLGNVIRIPAYRPPNVKDLGYHVAAYPEELVAFFLECYTDPGDRVLDPFLGSGTTLKVCQTMGRSGVGFEINRGFLPLIVSKIREPWKVPDWRDLDILHSSTITPGSAKPRKSQFSRRGRRGPSRLADGPAPEGNEDQRA
ncbi:MAG: site-specific DNA-methyltransferase [Planctomycetaceae bacterium]|nr:site-specific DNA-methyltransferase [Planctomycetaceae bacterium]MBV8606231.1 site-specific DNA-methyltransferase [Singulisphaera sp.]